MENFKMMFESENIYYAKLNKELINDYLEMVNNYEVQKFIVIILKNIPMKMN